ncbi:hypothetical protein [Campylobacter fetus]|uniref:hypothetical protein n=1 Tax=Campylobacter fetus TaxID=196 RepID=UPI000FCB83C8|nr:hypothetical protein [Campylobacter fetus]RUT51008.1 hypothetical protein BWK67_00345 [Campylobacter fetus]RUT51736.1 hypothetical protein BWK51_00345 [Campylobacter fetus]
MAVKYQNEKYKEESGYILTGKEAKTFIDYTFKRTRKDKIKDISKNLNVIREFSNRGITL